MKLVLNEHLELMFIGAIRYAIGRSSYMPSSVMEYMRPLLPKLTDKTLYVIKEDIPKEIEWREKINKKEIMFKKEWMEFWEEVCAEWRSRKQ